MIYDVKIQILTSTWDENWEGDMCQDNTTWTFDYLYRIKTNRPLTDDEIKTLAYERAIKEDEDFKSDVEYYFDSTSFEKVILGKKAESRYGTSAEIEFIITENKDKIVEIVVTN